MDSTLNHGFPREPHWTKARSKGVSDREDMRFLCSFAGDIMEKRQRAEMLRLTRKLEEIELLAGEIAHDLNTLMNVILGNADMALEQVPQGGIPHDCLLEIRKAAHRSHAMALQFTAPACGRPLCPCLLDLNEAVSEMFGILKSLVGEKVHLTWLPCLKPCLVNMESYQLDRILTNLCVNARHAMEDRGEVIVETDRVILDERALNGPWGLARGNGIPGEEYVVLTVSDNGCGMNEEILGRIFEPFFTTREAGKGTGLGLATVHDIVRRNRGFIHVDSEPDRGTTFKVFLPGCEAPCKLDNRVRTSDVGGVNG